MQVGDRLNARGKLLGEIRLAELGIGHDPDKDYSNWAVSALRFAGPAKSINFGGTVNRIASDNIAFGSTSPNDVPEHGSRALLMACGVAVLSQQRAARQRTR